MVKKLKSENSDLNIPYSADFISVLAKHVSSNNYDVIILPTLRACRALKEIVQKNIQITTFSELSNNHFKKCSNEDFRFAVFKTVNEAGKDFISADELYEFAVKYFTHCEDIESLKAINNTLYSLLKKTVEIIESKGFEVPQIANNKAVDRVIESWGDKKVLAVVPHTSSKYILRYLKSLSGNGQSLIVHGTDNDIQENECIREYIEFKNEYEEAEFIVDRIVKAQQSDPNKSIGIISTNSLKNKIIIERLKSKEISVNNTLEASLMDSPTIKLFIQLLSLHIDPSVKNILRVLKNPAFKQPKEEVLQFERDVIRKGKFESSVLDFISEDFKKDIDKLVSSKNISEIFNVHIQIFEKYFEIVDIQAFQKLKTLFSEHTFNLNVDLAEYRDILIQLIRGLKYREESKNNGSIEITSLIESNLIKYDLIFFTEFTEDNYSGIRRSKRYLSKEQEKALGFPDDGVDEIKAKALFFSQFSSKEVVITYPTTISGKQNTRSNILELIRKDLKFLQSNANIVGRKIKIERPVIKCNEARSKLSVTAIERLMQDPYAFYAYYFLNLKPLEKLDLGFSNREFGNVVHSILSSIDFNFPEEVFIEKFCAEFQKHTQHFGVDKHDIIWLRRAKKIAKGIFDFNSARASITKKIHKEIEGSLKVGNIRITGKADRIDIKNDGTCDIIDYKTGSIPNNLEIQRGEKPQFGIEAVILENNGFEFAEAKLDQLVFIDLKCKEDSEIINNRKVDLDLFKDGLTQLIEKFFVTEKLFFANFQSDENPFTLEFSKLSRNQEWN